ncbi:hypothetical protein SAMN05421749_101310 [Acinetobacter marinus]|uniref:Uncharacterized protein n=1 Tax=Acinetobacter marinus TaxID=281375 RepID=A0A1G6GR50_9GAMM|nr:hypothetical protein [Acinetobacter marinus]SDB84497.1 hypothetical protein SAMN05421749_101310 [Acinetobacter marinus]
MKNQQEHIEKYKKESQQMRAKQRKRMEKLKLEKDRQEFLKSYTPRYLKNTFWGLLLTLLFLPIFLLAIHLIVTW